MNEDFNSRTWSEEHAQLSGGIDRLLETIVRVTSRLRHTTSDRTLRRRRGGIA